MCSVGNLMMEKKRKDEERCVVMTWESDVEYEKECQKLNKRYREAEVKVSANSIEFLWYGMVWYGMVWYGMVWYGMVWYGMVWSI